MNTPLNNVLPNEIPFLTANSAIAADYTFDASARTITVNEIGFKKFTYIYNATYGQVIYNPYNPELSGTVSNDIITLNFPTDTYMTDADDLFVVYETKDITLHSSKNFTIQGVNEAVGTSYVDICDHNLTNAPPSAAETLQIVSTNTNDSAAGTNARMVLVEGLDADYNFQSEIVTLNGTTSVNLVNQYLRTRRMLVITAGTRGFRNAGDITLSSGGVTRLQIKTDNGSSFSSLYTVPAGHRGYNNRFDVFTPRSDDMDIRPIITPFGASSASSSGGPFKIYETALSVQQMPAFPLPEKTDVAIQARAASGNTNAVTVLLSVLEEKII